MAAVESYKVVLYSLESLEGYDELAKEVQEQIDSIWETLSKEHSNTTIIKSKKNVTESNVDTGSTKNNLTDEIKKAKDEL
jgi:septation ring formation regulator EzrA